MTDTLKVSYSPIFESYLEVAHEIDTVFEADIGTGTTATPPTGTPGKAGLTSATTPMDNPAIKNTLWSKIKHLIEVIVGKLTTFAQKLKNSFQLIMRGNDNFIRSMRESSTITNPKPAVKVVTYDYNEVALLATYGRYREAVLRIFSRSTPQMMSDPALDAGGFNQVHQELLKKAFPDDVTDIPKAMAHLKTKFRGEKGEKTIQVAQLPQFENAISTYKGQQAVFTHCVTTIQKRMGEMKREVDKFVTQNKADQKTSGGSTNDTKQIQARCRTVIMLGNAFISITQMTYELLVERQLAAREVVRLFYYNLTS